MFVTLTLNPAVDCTWTVADRLAFGKVHRVLSETRTPGGKGCNVAKVLAANGHKVCAGGIMGHDQAASYRRFLAAANIASEFLIVPQPTRQNFMAADGYGAEIKFNQRGFPELEFDWPALKDYCLKLATHGKVIILSGSLPERFPPDTYARLIRLFQEAGKITVLDTSGPALAGGLAAGPSVIKPNRQELEACLGRALRSDHDLAAELRKLSATLELVVVSDGPNGAYFAGRGKILHAGSPPVTVKDTTGSGDSLLGQLCADYFGDGRRELTAAIAARAVAAGAAAAEVRGSPLLARERIQQLAALTHATQL